MSEAEGSNAKQLKNNPEELCQPTTTLINDIGVFDGGTGQDNHAMEWLLRFNSTASDRQWPNHLKLKTVQQYLVGMALEWYSSEITYFTSWTRFESAFKQRFTAGDNVFQNYIYMKKRVQRNDESTDNYVNDKVRLCQSFGMDFACIKEEILFGLSSRELANSLLIGKHTDKAGILHDILKYENTKRSPLTPKLEAQIDKPKASDGCWPLANYKFPYNGQARINKCYVIPCVIDLEFSDCLMPEYLANDCNIKWRIRVTTVYELKTQKIIRVLGSARICIEVDKALADDVLVFIVDNVTCYHGIFIGSSWCNSAQIAYERNGQQLHNNYGIDQFPYAFMDNTIFGDPLNHLVTSSLAILAPETLTLVNALVGETKVDVLVSNVTNQKITLKAKHLLARRVDIISDYEPDYYPFNRKINVKDIKLPVGLNKTEQNRLLMLLNNHRQCFVTDMFTLDMLKNHNIAGQEVNNVPMNMSVSESFLNSLPKNSSKYIYFSQNMVNITDSVLRVYKKKEETRIIFHQGHNIINTPPYPLLPTDYFLQLFTSKTLFTMLEIVNNHLDIPFQTDKKNIDRTIACFHSAPFEYTPYSDWSTEVIKSETTINCFDHYIISADDWTDMEHKLDIALTALSNVNLTVRLKNCVFASPSIKFLGYKIMNGLLKPSRKKILQIVQYKTPETVLDVRRFIRLARFFDKFLPKFAEVIKPITDLCRKRVTFEWTDKHEKAFKSFKLQLIKSPVLHLFNSLLYTELHIDVTFHLLSAKLYQKDKDGEKKLIYCISKVTSVIDRSYHFNKLILKALFWSLEKLSDWLNFQVVTIIMDCQSMFYMNIMKVTDLECFQYNELLIQEQNFVLIHNATKIIKHENENMSYEISGLQTRFHMQYLQYNDPEIIKIIKELSEQPRLHKNKYEFDNGLVYYISSTKTVIRKLLMIPKIMRKLTVIHFHDQGHLSLDKTVEIIQETFYFSRLRRYVKVHIKYCSVCTPQKLSRDQRRNAQLSTRPFDTIHIKHLGPFPMSNKGNQYVFVIIDDLTLYSQIYTSPSCTTEAMIKHLKCFTNKFRLPKRIVSNKSKIFTSLPFGEFCKTNGIENRQVYGHHQPQVNQDVECTNNNILAVIYTYINKEEVWDHELDILEKCLNTTKVSLMKISPLKSVLYYSEIYQDKIIDILRLQEQHDNLSYNIRNEYAIRLEFGQFMWKDWFKPYGGIKTLCVGSIVFLQDREDPSEIKYLGPMIIVKQLTELSYTVLQFDFKNFASYVFPDVHISSMKIYEGKADSFEYFTERNIIANIKNITVITNDPELPPIQDMVLE